jgi:hypothetical protein
MRHLFASAILIIGLSTQSAFAQQASTSSGPHRQLATIIYAGLGGSILGLSTLSFYGKPQEKLSNIAIGFAFGIISGTIYVTYQAAAHPNDFYSQATTPDETLSIATESTRSLEGHTFEWVPLQHAWVF